MDRLTGDLWIADVGESAREEIDYQPVKLRRWLKLWMEYYGGNFFLPPNAGCNPVGLTLPIYDYPHIPRGGSIIGGYLAVVPNQNPFLAPIFLLI